MTPKEQIKKTFLTADQLTQFTADYSSAARILMMCHSAAIKNTCYIELNFDTINDKSLEVLKEMGYSIHLIHEPYISKRNARLVYFHVIFNMNEYLKHNQDKHELNLL